MYAYVDETGNTGQNIFDETQPHFLTAALVTRTNFDALHAHTLKTIARSVGVDTLHANELGPAKIEEIADPIRKLLKRVDPRFIFSNVEKKYLAVTKIVDHVFDTGENKAVPWQAYNLRPLRILLVFKVAYLVDLSLAKSFWDALMEPNGKAATEKWMTACRVLLSRVGDLPDARSREIVGEALRWAIDNPDEFAIHSRNKHARYGHLPNMVAFINLIDGIDNQSKRWGRSVKLITHDEQMQFERGLKQWHQIYSNASPEPLHWPGEAPRVLQQVPGSTFVMAKDNASPGIQVADVLLWLFKRMVDEKEFSRDSARLLNFALSRALSQDLSFKNVSRQLSQSFDKVHSTPISDDQLRTAQELLQQEKQSREQSLLEHAQTLLENDDT